MVFSSLVFLFLFLPAVLGLYFIVPKALRNTLLLLASLFFYAWGEGFFVVVMLGSIAFNHGCGLLLDRFRQEATGKIVLALAILGNIGLLVFYKYANFLVANLNGLLEFVGASPLALEPIHLPIGISFFTFQAMSYSLDVYRREAPVQRNPFDIALYVALFPQLIAGPIVRYQDVALQLKSRVVDLEGFAHGIRRFLIGFGKKVIVANALAVPADNIFDLRGSALTPAIAWLGTLCYTFQIYFDFSGYSDMAIGLGRMFGFHFLENFNYPYISQSIREFWRRWHISLSTWFRDYLYIPLGGNRGSRLRTHANLVIVFFLCGFWHGAAWTFVAWGLYHGAFLVLERTPICRRLERLPRFFRHGYVLLTVMIGWVFFRADSFTQALWFFKSMAFLHTNPKAPPITYHLNREVALMLCVAAVGSTPVLPWLFGQLGAIRETLSERASRRVWLTMTLLGHLGLVIILIYGSMLLAATTHNPFIYFRF